jgi:hypothetical protein
VVARLLRFRPLTESVARMASCLSTERDLGVRARFGSIAAAITMPSQRG